MTLGVPVAESGLASNQQLVVMKDNVELATQWNELSTWHSSPGQTLHGAATFFTPAAGTNSGTYELVVGSAQSGPAVTKADVLDTSFDATIAMTIGGNSYSLSVRDLFSGSALTRRDYLHMSGPMMSSFAVGGGLRLNGIGQEHDSIQGYFEVRAYRTGGSVERVYVTCTLENTALSASAENTTGAVRITVGGSTVYLNDSLTCYRDKRYIKRFWWGGDPKIYRQLDVNYIQSTKLVPQYRSISPSASIWSGFSEPDWNEVGQVPRSMADGGAAPHIGPLSRWDAAYLCGGGVGARSASRYASDVYRLMENTFGSYPFRTRDEATGFPIDLSIHASVTGGELEVSGGSANSGILTNDFAHMPSVAYLNYLLDCEVDDLDEMQFNLSAVFLSSYSSTGWPRRIPVIQVRGEGWALRNVVDAANMTPNHHPLKQYTTEAVLAGLESQWNYRSGDVNNLGIGTTQGNSRWLAEFAPDSDAITAIFSYMADYNMLGIVYAAERGYLTECKSLNDGKHDLLSWRALRYREFLKNDGSGASLSRIGQYTMHVWDGNGSWDEDNATAAFPDWDTAMSHPYNFGPGTSQIVKPGDAFLETSDVGPTHYLTYAMTVVGHLMDLGYLDNEEAWSLYDGRAKPEWGPGYDYESLPEWAIDRRT